MEMLCECYRAVQMLVTIVTVITEHIMGAQLCHLVPLNTI